MEKRLQILEFLGARMASFEKKPLAEGCSSQLFFWHAHRTMPLK